MSGANNYHNYSNRIAKLLREKKADQKIQLDLYHHKVRTLVEEIPYFPYNFNRVKNNGAF